MAHYSEQQLQSMGLKHLGKRVKISDKAGIYDFDRIEIDDVSGIDDVCVVSGNTKIGNNMHLAAYRIVAGVKKGVESNNFPDWPMARKFFSQSDAYSGNTLTNPIISKKYKRETNKKVWLGTHEIVGTSIVFTGVNITVHGIYL